MRGAATELWARRRPLPTLSVTGDRGRPDRARDQLKTFVAERGLSIAAWYVENKGGAKLSRPELFRLSLMPSPATSCLWSRWTFCLA